MCDDDLREGMTPALKPLETPQFRSSEELNDGLFLPMTWESPLCLLFPQPRPRVGLLRLLPSPTLSKHAAPTELSSVGPAKLPQTQLLIKAKAIAENARGVCVILFIRFRPTDCLKPTCLLTKRISKEKLP